MRILALKQRRARSGNIYRAEILFKAGVHPNVKGIDLGRARFDRVWLHTFFAPLLFRQSSPDHDLRSSSARCAMRGTCCYQNPLCCDLLRIRYAKSGTDMTVLVPGRAATTWLCMRVPPPLSCCACAMRCLALTQTAYRATRVLCDA
eukprot:3847984-Rhodomonas_salina.1